MKKRSSLAMAFALSIPSGFAAQLDIVEEGGFLDGSDLALEGGAVAFAIDSLAGFPIHVTPHLNDGLYGNDFSWIGNSGNPGFAGIALAGPRTIASIAFGRDNTGMFGDRCLGVYVLQYTTVDRPDEFTPVDEWINIGTIENLGSCPPMPGIRHRYDCSGTPATGIRLIVPGTGMAAGICIDELEVYGEHGEMIGNPCPEDLALLETGGPATTPAGEADVPGYDGGNAARSPDAVPFGTPPFLGRATPDIADGVYGDGHAWIGVDPGTFSGKVYAGIYFADGLRAVEGIALGRDNTGVLGDRAIGAHTVQFTADDFVPEDDASVESARWTTIGRAAAHLSGAGRGLRRLYGFDPIDVRAIRVLTAAGNAFDEIELTAADAVPPEKRRFRRGDADGSGKIDLTDAIFTLQFLFMGGTPPACKDAADTDDSGKLDLTDAIASLQFQFMGGAPPAAPGPLTCGPDPSEGDEYVDCVYEKC